MNPTKAAYAELQAAYDHFNKRLFDGALPPCLLTLQREKKSFGYYSHKRFVTKNGETTDEIALNPCYFAVHPIQEHLQTIVHEMTHLWQFHFGKPVRKSYHNKEWADKMESIGLMPSSTGKPGGKKTGQKVADYCIEGGPFEKASMELVGRDFSITWMDRFPVVKEISEVPEFIHESIAAAQALDSSAPGLSLPGENKSNRNKYQCAPCEINVWGKPGLNLICGECQEPFQELSIAGAG